MNLPSDLQRLLPYVAVAVLAVVGLFLVMRGIGSDETSVPPTPPPVQRENPGPGNRGSGSEGSGSGYFSRMAEHFSMSGGRFASLRHSR